MAITTTIARHYFWKQTAVGVLCVVFAAWGAFDLWGQEPLSLGFTSLHPIPYKQRLMDEYKQLQTEIKAYDDKVAGGETLTDAEVTVYEAKRADLTEITKDGVPEPVSSWDKPTQWLFISCILFAPFCFWAVIKTRSRVYTLDDDGTLHMPEGTWPKEEIAEIDMSRWMSKSMAEVVHVGGKRVLLDDYKHKNLHLIIGAIASRLDPEEWTEDARPRKKVEAEEAAKAAARKAEAEAEHGQSEEEESEDSTRDEQRQEV